MKRVQNKQGAYKLNFLPQVIHANIWQNLKLNRSEYEVCELLWIKQTDGPSLCFEDQFEGWVKNVGEGS